MHFIRVLYAFLKNACIFDKRACLFAKNACTVQKCIKNANKMHTKCKKNAYKIHIKCIQNTHQMLDKLFQYRRKNLLFDENNRPHLGTKVCLTTASHTRPIKLPCAIHNLRPSL